MMYLFTTVPHPHGHWQLQELLGNHLWSQCMHGPKYPKRAFENILKQDLLVSHLHIAGIMQHGRQCFFFQN